MVMPNQCKKKTSLVVLHHRPFSDLAKHDVLIWAMINFQNIISIALLHGHEHNDRKFSADFIEEDFGGIHIIISNVYSANVNGKRDLAGCANLLDIALSGEISVKTVFDT